MHTERKLGERRTSERLLAMMDAPDTVVRDVDVFGRVETVEIEECIWHDLVEIADRADQSVGDVCAAIRCRYGLSKDLATAIRVFVLNVHRGGAEPDSVAMA